MCCVVRWLSTECEHKLTGLGFSKTSWPVQQKLPPCQKPPPRACKGIHPAGDILLCRRGLDRDDVSRARARAPACTDRVVHEQLLSKQVPCEVSIAVAFTSTLNTKLCGDKRFQNQSKDGLASTHQLVVLWDPPLPRVPLPDMPYSPPGLLAYFACQPRKHLRRR